MFESARVAGISGNQIKINGFRVLLNLRPIITLIINKPHYNKHHESININVVGLRFDLVLRISIEITYIWTVELCLKDFVICWNDYCPLPLILKGNDKRMGYMCFEQTTFYNNYEQANLLPIVPVGGLLLSMPWYWDF